MVVPLRRIIHGDIPEFISIAISGFTCRDNDVETFLKEKAFDFEKRNKSRTYLIFDDNKVLLGYYTLSLKALPFTSTVSKSMIKNIDGFSKDVKAIGVVLIGQFGKDKVLAKNIKGSTLFDFCIETVYAAQDIIGGRVVMLECREEIDNVVSFYKVNGFERLQRDERDGYLQMIRRL